MQKARTLIMLCSPEIFAMNFNLFIYLFTYYSSFNFLLFFIITIFILFIYFIFFVNLIFYYFHLLILCYFL